MVYASLPPLCQWNKKISELDTSQFFQGGNLIQSFTSKSTCRQVSRYVVNYNTSAHNSRK